MVLVDTGDNVGGGSAADGTVLLAELLRQGATDGVVCLYAPEEVRQCAAAGVGREVTLTVGGKVDRLHGDPLTVTGRVRLLHDGTYVEPAGAARRQARQSHGADGAGGAAGPQPAGADLAAPSAVQPGAADVPGHPAGAAAASWWSRRPSPTRRPTLPVAGTVIEVDTPGLTAVNPRALRVSAHSPAAVSAA